MDWNERKCVFANLIDSCVNRALDRFFRPFDEELYNLKPSLMFSTIVFACYAKLYSQNPYGFDVSREYSVYYRNRYEYPVWVHPQLFSDVSLFIEHCKPPLQEL